MIEITHIGQSFSVFVYIWPIILFLSSLLTSPWTLPQMPMQHFSKIPPQRLVGTCLHLLWGGVAPSPNPPTFLSFFFFFTVFPSLILPLLVLVFLSFYFFFLAVLGLHCCQTFLWLHEQGLLSSCSTQASHCGGFSCCRAQALGCVSLEVWFLD